MSRVPRPATIQQLLNEASMHDAMLLGQKFNCHILRA
jgi:hypothetical protein